MISLGLEGHSDDGGRDLTVDAMRAVAVRLDRRYQAQVHAVRYRARLRTVDGFMVWTGPVTAEGWMGPVLYVAVRRRVEVGRWAGPWQEVRTVAAAASEIAASVPRR